MALDHRLDDVELAWAEIIEPEDGAEDVEGGRCFPGRGVLPEKGGLISQWSA